MLKQVETLELFHRGFGDGMHGFYGQDVDDLSKTTQPLLQRPLLFLEQTKSRNLPYIWRFFLFCKICTRSRASACGLLGLAGRFRVAAG